jgi:lipopolysaccharide transport system ATP-binding protein
MSSDLALHVRGLGKRYEIGARQYRYGTLRERIAAAAARPWRRLTGREPVAGPTTSIWALEDVSFDVHRGDVLGIIGGNGAGKSTLLKILSRITEPTAGEAALFGRVGSLLEVGTGFHPDLTGRENIYLNGAILGMRKAEIDRKFDEIVAFAEVDAFVDTPVRHYSSGMYVRLAFAVAAQLEPEILIVDEVLAVGDVRFQKKCLGKMNDVARSGRTVLFVSHNMAAIQRLCTRALLLDRGRVAADGRTAEVTARYLSGDARPTFAAAARTGEPQIVHVALRDVAGRPLARAVITAPLVIEIGYVLPHPSPGTCVGIGVLTGDGTAVFSSDSRDDGVAASGAADEYLARVTVPASTLLAGDFQLAVCLWNERDVLDLQEPALTFSMDPGASPLYEQLARRTGVVQVRCAWEIATRSDVGVS